MKIIDKPLYSREEDARMECARLTLGRDMECTKCSCVVQFEHLDEFEVDGIPHVEGFNMGIGHVKAKCPSCGVIRNFYGMWGKQEKKNLRWWEVWK